MIASTSTLIDKAYCYISSQASAEAVFDEIGEKLYEAGLVTEDFAIQIKMREQEFPTGLDLTPVHDGLIGIAVPHTESEYTKAKMVIPIKLEQPFYMRNMINPETEVEVNFMFMILNNDPSGQANILATIMGGITSNDRETLEEINRIENEADVYRVATKILGE